MQFGALAEVVGLRPLEPQRCIHDRSALYAQPRLVNHSSIVFLRSLAFGAAERLGHFHQIVPLGLCHEPRKHQQFAALLLGEAIEMRTVGFYGAQHARAAPQVVVGNRGGRGVGMVHRRIVCRTTGSRSRSGPCSVTERV